MWKDDWVIPSWPSQKTRLLEMLGLPIRNYEGWLEMLDLPIRYDERDNKRFKALGTLSELDIRRPACTPVLRKGQQALEGIGYVEGVGYPAALAQHAGDVVDMLEDSSHVVRFAAVQTLAELEPAALAQHADAVTAWLKVVNRNVRIHALLTLCTLEPGTLAQHAGAVIGRLEDPFLGGGLR